MCSHSVFWEEDGMPRLLLRDDQWVRIEGLLRGKHGDRGRRVPTIACLLKQCSGRHEQERRGVIFRSHSDLGIPRSVASRAGLTKAYGKPSSPNFPKTPISKRCFLAVRLSARTSLRQVHQKKGQQGIGRSRGGLSTKIHTAVDGLGNLGRFRLTGGERHDITEAANLLDGLEQVGAVLADKAFDAASLLARIRELGAKAVIPPRANRNESHDYDVYHYRSRNLIERFFARIKQFRRIATRYDKLAAHFEAFISITAAFIWLA